MASLFVLSHHLLQKVCDFLGSCSRFWPVPRALSYDRESTAQQYPFGQGRGLPLIGSMPNRLFCPEDLGGSGELTLVLVDQHAQVLDPELSEG
jgi:hypothetical protein